MVPLINPNENEALLAALKVQAGQFVAPGELIAVLETTKSTYDLAVESGGYIAGLGYQQGNTISAGEILCYLVESPDIVAPRRPSRAMPATSEPSSSLPAGLRITQPALALAREQGLDFARLPTGQLVTEAVVRQFLELSSDGAPARAALPVDPAALIIYGGGGHGKSLIDMVRTLGGYHLVGVVDDGKPAGSQVLGFEFLGGAEVLAELYLRGVRLAVNAVGGIGNLAPRLKVFDSLEQAGFTCPTLVHPTAMVEGSATLSDGVQVFPHAYVGSDVRVGFGCIVNTGAIVSHDGVLGDYSNVSPGAMLAGGVEVGPRALIGMGVTINLGVKVGAAARIGNSATVIADVPAGGVVHAGSIWRG